MTNLWNASKFFQTKRYKFICRRLWYISSFSFHLLVFLSHVSNTSFWKTLKKLHTNQDLTFWFLSKFWWISFLLKRYREIFGHRNWLRYWRRSRASVSTCKISKTRWCWANPWAIRSQYWTRVMWPSPSTRARCRCWARRTFTDERQSTNIWGWITTQYRIISS